MSDFLDSLVERSFGTAGVLEPRLPSRFEPAPAPQMSPLSDPSNGDSGSDSGKFEFSVNRNGALEGPPENATAGSVTHANQAGVVAHSPVAVDDGTQSMRGRDSSSAVDRVSSDSVARAGDPPAAASVSRGRATTDGTAWLHRRIDELSWQLSELGRMGDLPPHRHDGAEPLDRGSERDLPEAISRPIETATNRTFTEPPAGQQSAAIREDGLQLHVSQRSRTSAGDDEESVYGERLAAAFSAPAPQQLSPSPSPPRIVPESLPHSREAPAPPTINVTIGRVEVKATREAAPQTRQSDRGSGPAVMSLAQYLERRAAGAMR